MVTQACAQRQKGKQCTCIHATLTISYRVMIQGDKTLGHDGHKWIRARMPFGCIGN